MPVSGDGVPEALPPVSVIVVCTNERRFLSDCLGSLERQSYPRLEVLLVDNNSEDGSVEYVREHFPRVRIVSAGHNLGYASANNLGFRSAQGDLLIVLNPDTEVEPDFVSALVAAFEDPRVGLATPRILYFEDRGRVNTCGNDIHWSCIAYCRGLDQPAGNYDAPVPVSAISGCAFMVRGSLLKELGAFDDDFFIYLEDTDLSLRYRLAGYDIRYVPDSIVYHRYGVRLTPGKFFLIERNRRLVVLKNFRWRTILSLIPSLFLTGCLMWLYALARGPAFVRSKVRAQLWPYLNWRRVRDKRRQVQRLRRRPDRDLVRLLKSDFPFEQLAAGNRLVKALSGPLNGLYSVISLPTRLLAA